MIIKIIILISVVILLIVIFWDLFYRYYLLKLFGRTYSWVSKDLAFLSTISGYIRKGKTTLSFGIMHLKTLDLINRLKQKMFEIESILIDVNFLKIRTSYDNLLKTGLDHDSIVIQIINDLKIVFNDEVILIQNLNNLYFDYLKQVHYLKYLVDYLYCYSHLLKHHYVFSNVKVFNQITTTYSLQLNYEWLKLKERINNFKDFPLEEYTFNLFDEMTLENSNNSAIKKLYEDNGSDVFYRLSGQLFRETSFFTVTLQNVQRWYKSDREVFQQHIFVRDSYLINTCPLKSKFINLLDTLNSFIYSKFKDEDFLNSNNFFKRMRLKFLNWNKKNISRSFIKFKTSIYTEIDQVGKFIKDDQNSENAYNFDFVLPVPYCWEVGDTHLFHRLFIYLQEHSNLSSKEVNITEIDDDDIADLLVKYSDKNNNSSADF